MTENDTQLLYDAIAMHGERAQFLKAAEEASELAAAICRHLVEYSTVDHLIEEMADVGIMLDQMTLMLGKGTQEQLDSWRMRKLARLAMRLTDRRPVTSGT